MKFTCLSENLAKGLSIVNKAISSKATLPVLSNVLLSTESGRLKLSVTNQDTSITTFIGASIDEEGAITVPARLLHEFISNLETGNVVGEVKGTALHLSSEKASSKFLGIDAQDFPDLPKLPKKFNLTIDPKVFSEAVLETSFSAAIDESRPILTGVYLCASESVLSVAAVDGFRLSERTLKLKEKIKDEFTCVVPAKILAETARLLTSSKEPLEISVSEETPLAIFKSGDIVLTTTLIEGDFPDYKKLIPSEEKLITSATFLSKDFEKALRLANVFAKEATNIVKLKVDSDKEVLYVSSSSVELGENKSAVTAEVEGKNVEISFNSKFIMEVLANVKREKFTFNFPEKVGTASPALIKAPDDSSFTALIMPLQV